MTQHGNTVPGNTVPGNSLPGKHRRRSWFGSIRTRMIVCFSLGFVLILVLVELAGIAGIPFTSNSGRLGEQRAETFRSLDLIADLKKERLQRLLEEFRADVHVCATNYMVEENVVQLHSAVGRLASKTQSDEQLWSLVQQEEPFKKLVHYLDVIRRTYAAYDEIEIVTAATGRILVSTNAAAVGDSVSDQPYFMNPLWSREPYTSPVTVTAESPRPFFHVSHVIHRCDADSSTFEAPAGQPIAVLVMRVNTDDIIKPMLHTGEGLGKKGEALLVDREGEILTSLKHPLPDGTVPQPLQYRITALPAVLAAGGEEGIIDARDYRGEPVLAAYRHIRVTPEWGWGLVVKIDKAELYAPLRAEITYTFWLGLVGILAFVALATILARGLSGPIRALSQTAEKVMAGDLSARGPEATSDEVGLLTTTFNTMIERVENWHTELRDQVRARTSELRKANELLAAEIGERELAEQERVKLIAELESKNAELERFAYTVSHDLKSPLITIKGYMGMLKEDMADGDVEAVEDDVKRVAGAADRMEQLLEELLELSRIGRLVNEPEHVPLGELVRDAVDLVGGQIDREGVRVEISPDLPAVFGDRARLLEVVQNLVDNSVKYMGDQPRPRVEIGALLGNGETICYVRDNGIGIDARYQEKIFGLFDQLDRKVEGSGIGLALVKRIVEVHGGRIWVESDGPGQGSTFYFTIPSAAESTEITRETGK